MDRAIVNPVKHSYFVHPRHNDHRYFKLRGSHHQVRSTRRHQHASIRQHGVAADDDLVASRHHGERGSVVDECGLDVLLSQLQSKLLTQERWECLADNHTDVASVGVVPVGILEKSRDCMGLGIGEHHLSREKEERRITRS